MTLQSRHKCRSCFALWTACASIIAGLVIATWLGDYCFECCRQRFRIAARAVSLHREQRNMILSESLSATNAPTSTPCAICAIAAKLRFGGTGEHGDMTVAYAKGPPTLNEGDPVHTAIIMSATTRWRSDVLFVGLSDGVTKVMPRRTSESPAVWLGMVLAPDGYVVSIEVAERYRDVVDEDVSATIVGRHGVEERRGDFGSLRYHHSEDGLLQRIVSHRGASIRSFSVTVDEEGRVTGIEDDNATN